MTSDFFIIRPKDKVSLLLLLLLLVFFLCSPRICIDMNFFGMLKEIGACDYLDTLHVIKRAQKSADLKFLHPLLKTKSGGDSLSQTSLFAATKGAVPPGAHQADFDVQNLLSILSSDPLKPFFTEATPVLPLSELLTKKKKCQGGPKKPRKPAVACTECGKKRHVSTNPCSKNKNKRSKWKKKKRACKMHQEKCWGGAFAGKIKASSKVDPQQRNIENVPNWQRNETGRSPEEIPSRSGELQNEKEN